MPQNVREILQLHEAELVERLRRLRNEIIPLERELAEVRRARFALDNTDYGPQQRQIVFDPVQAPPNSGETAGSDVRISPYAQLTIKALVRKALDEQFERGATANELLEFFRDAWGRSDIVRTSLSPQLSRLKQDGELILVGQRWMLRRAYHPTESETKNAKAATDA